VGIASPSDLAVYVGANKIYEGTQYTVKEVAVHPGYDNGAKINDIALISLGKSLRFSDRVGKVCLPRQSASKYVGQGLTVSGWGVISEDGKETPDLQVVRDIKILEECGE
jgi:secreted trypsin-like serine protease